MKKIYFTTAVVAMAVSIAPAQDTSESSSETVELMKSKNGYVIPAEEGDWSIGISGTSNVRNFFMSSNTVGSFFQAPYPTPSNANYAPASSGIVVSSKKMLDANTAIRLRLGADIWRDADKATTVASSLNSPKYATFVDDWMIRQNTALYLAGGLEKRRGKGRLFGIYGGELVLGMSSLSIEFQYGNPITNDFKDVSTLSNPLAITNASAFTSDFGLNNVIAPAAHPSVFPHGARMIEQKGGRGLLVGARAFVGVEYFIFPKISLGGEFGYMLNYQTTFITTQTFEYWNPDINGVSTYKRDIEPIGRNYGSRWSAGFENLSGNISMNFYF
ncbi:MAG: hypothetical protein NZM38_05470 [Cytophagales bacterium]|nr:hypothetical protein [Cytophagales bacterium]MDW8384204.1 hypothetical protein [Flammeovirgaceae bacterium]